MGYSFAKTPNDFLGYAEYDEKGYLEQLMKKKCKYFSGSEYRQVMFDDGTYIICIKYHLHKVWT